MQNINFLKLKLKIFFLNLIISICIVRTCYKKLFCRPLCALNIRKLIIHFCISGCFLKTTTTKKVQFRTAHSAEMAKFTNLQQYTKCTCMHYKVFIKVTPVGSFNVMCVSLWMKVLRPDRVSLRPSASALTRANTADWKPSKAKLHWWTPLPCTYSAIY